MATYLGGTEILEQLSSKQLTDPLNYYNVALLFISPMLWGLLNIYKRMKFRGRMDYSQRLQQLVLGGRTNTARKIILFGQFFFCAVFFVGHFWASWSLKNKEEKEDPISTAFKANIFIGIMMTICSGYPFIGSRALR